jgi:hypothetical protein
MLYTSPWSGFELITTVVKGTDCIGSFNSNYHTITVMTVPNLIGNLVDREYDTVWNQTI